MPPQAPGDVEEPTERPNEAALVEAWRLERFLDQGWAPERADVLLLLGVDWHDAERLLGYGHDFEWVYDQLT